MSITVTCECGQQFAAGEKLAGKRVKCPKCGHALVVPVLPAKDVLDDLLAEGLPEEPATASPLGAPLGDPLRPAGFGKSAVSIQWSRFLPIAVACVVGLVALVFVGTFVWRVMQETVADLAAENQPEEARQEGGGSPIAPTEAITPVPTPSPQRPAEPPRQSDSRPVPPRRNPQESRDPQKSEVKTANTVRDISLRQYRGVRRLAFSSDGKLLYTAGHDKSLRVWDIASGKMVGQLGRAEEEISAMAVSPDGEVLVTKGGRMLRVFDMEKRKPRHEHELQATEFTTDYVGYSYDGKYAVTAMDGDVVMFSTLSGREVRHEYGHFVLFMATYPLENQVALVKQLTRLELDAEETTSETLGVDLMDLDTGQVRSAVFHPSAELPESPGSIAFSPDGQLLVVSTYDGPLVLLSTASWEPRSIIQRNSQAGFHTYAKMVISTEGSTIVGNPVYRTTAETASGRFPPELWHTSGGPMSTLGSKGAADVAIAPTGLLAVAELDGPVRFFDSETGEEVVP